MIAFIQPFGLQAPGGGSRILRGLLDCEHPPVLSICTAIQGAPPSTKIEEICLPIRPYLGRLERTRFHSRLRFFDRLYRSGFEDKLRRILCEHSVDILHVIPHAYDIVSAMRVATELQIPYFLTVHDDIQYTAMRHPYIKQIIQATGEAWRNAQGRFVISEAIGQEYSGRFGMREFVSVTDGLSSIAETALIRPGKSLRVYFMGLFHIRYGMNMRALLDALRLIRAQFPEWNISLTCRCGAVDCAISEDDVPITVLPFASEREVEVDLHSADILYQPLPFQEDSVAFGKFSLSTKLVTYLGSGLPVLYHGPRNTAAATLLEKHKAAAVATTLDPTVIALRLIEAIEKREEIVHNALQLARDQFLLVEQQRRFWQPMVTAFESHAL